MSPLHLRSQCSGCSPRRPLALAVSRVARRLGRDILRPSPTHTRSCDRDTLRSHSPIERFSEQNAAVCGRQATIGFDSAGRSLLRPSAAFLSLIHPTIRSVSNHSMDARSFAWHNGVCELASSVIPMTRPRTLSRAAVQSHEVHHWRTANGDGNRRLRRNTCALVHAFRWAALDPTNAAGRELGAKNGDSRMDPRAHCGVRRLPVLWLTCLCRA